MSGSATCPFCSQLADLGRSNSDLVVWEFPHSVALLGPWQYYHGYCVLVSRIHATELFHLSDIERRGYLEEMCLLARALDRAFHPKKLNYELLGNQVGHLHWHLFPRYADDPAALQPVWLAISRADSDPCERTRLETGPINRQETADRIRAVLQGY